MEINNAIIAKTALIALFMVFFVNTVMGQKTVVDIVIGSESHTTLEAAVIAAELADDLQGEGPFTVIAPTDAAFAALPEGTVESLLKILPEIWPTFCCSMWLQLRPIRKTCRRVRKLKPCREMN